VDNLLGMQPLYISVYAQQVSAFKGTAKRIVVQSPVIFIFIIDCRFIIPGSITITQTATGSLFRGVRRYYQESLVFDGAVIVIYECVYFFGRWTQLYESERLKKESLISHLELLKTRSATLFIQ